MTSTCPAPQPLSVLRRSHPEVVPPGRSHGIVTSNPWTSRYVEAAGLVSVSQGPPLNRQHLKLTPAHPLGQPAKHIPALSLNHPTTRALRNGADDPVSVISRDITVRSRVSKLREAFELDWNMNRKERLSRRMEGIVNETLRLGGDHQPTVLPSGQPGDLGRVDEIANGLGQLHPQKICHTKATVVPGSSNISTQQPSEGRMIQHSSQPESQPAPPACTTSCDLESRAERIARYKAERRRQLAEQFGINIPDDADVRSTPKRNECLNIVSPPEASARVSTSYSKLQIPGKVGITLKMQEDYKTRVSLSRRQDVVLQEASPSAATLKDPVVREDSSDSPTLRCRQIWGHKAQVRRNMPVPLENKAPAGMEEVKLHLPLESRTCRREEPRSRFLSSSLVEKQQEEFAGSNITNVSRLPCSNHDRTSIDHSPSLDSRQAILTSSRTEEVVTHPSADAVVLSALRGHKHAIARNGNSVFSLGKQPDFTAYVDHEPRPREDYRRHTVLGGGDSGITWIRDNPVKTTGSSNLLNTHRDLKRRERAHSSGAGWPSTPSNLKPLVKMTEGSCIVKNSGGLLHGLGSSQPSRQCTRVQSLVRSGISRECIRTCVEPTRQVEEPRRLNEFQELQQKDGEAEVSVGTRISVTELRSLFAETLRANSKSNVSTQGRSRNGESRRLNERFHTQPITSTERQQTSYPASQQEQGVVSASSQPLKRANTTDTIEGSDKTDEKARMSMAAKLSLFQAMGPVPEKAAAQSNTQKQPASLAWHQRSGPSRSRDVSQECPPHKSSQVPHSPTTCRAPVTLKMETTSKRDPLVHMKQDTYEEPDNSQLSLVEKMALFTRLGQAISSGVVPEQRTRRSSQRFQTQPVTVDELSSNLDHSNIPASEVGSSAVSAVKLAVQPAARTSQHSRIGAQVSSGAQQSFLSHKSMQTTYLSGHVQSSVNRQLTLGMSRNGGATRVAVPTLVEPSRPADSKFETTPATYNSGPGRGGEEEEEEPDNSRLTLAEKMALFTQLSKGGPQTLVQRYRRSFPRFQTQPVTASEVHSASLVTTSIAQVTSAVTYSQKQFSQQKSLVGGRPIQTGPAKAFKGLEGHHVPGTRAESDARKTSMESPFHAWRKLATTDSSLISRRSFDHLADTDSKQKTDSSAEQSVHVSVPAETTCPWRKGLKTREKMVDTRKQQLQSLPKLPLSNAQQPRTSPVDTVTSYKRSKQEDHGWKERVVRHINTKETPVRLEWQQRSQEIRQQQEIHIVGQREFAPHEKNVGEDARGKMGCEAVKVSFRPTESLSPARASHEVQKKDSKPPTLEWHSDLHRSSHWVSTTSDSPEIHDKYLDMVTESSSPRLLTSVAAEHRRAIRPARKSARSRNPLRVLAERKDVRTDLIERGSRRGGDQTEEGLRAPEVQRTSETISPHTKNRQTFQPLMLIQVKGRKHVQVRVVEPCMHSLGPDICAVLVTAQSCFLWLGHEANSSEKIKATKLAAQIQNGPELGCKASAVTVLEDRNYSSSDEAATFWTLLGAQQHAAPPCSPEKSTSRNEESYEHDIIATNCLFRLQGQCLVPDDKFWGKAPQHAILQTPAVLVFDFGTEIYTWIGEDVGPKSRRLAGLLAQQLWIGPYDYSTCRINPLGPCAARRGNGRPDWAVYSQIDQGREMLLFREKFLDWPGLQQEVRTKELIEKEEEAYVSQQMLSGTSKLVDRDLSHQAMDHLTGKQPITTSTEIWHITGASCRLLEQPTLAQFYDGDSYLVIWRFKLRNSGGKETEEGSRSEYCTSFLWQGKKALQGRNESMAESVLHKSGCRSKMLVPQGKEPAAFLRLFHGSLVILLGSKDKKMELSADRSRLFCVCGDLPGEGCLLETLCKVQSLRSRASMLLLDVRRRNLHLWHGCRSPAGNRNLSRRALAQLHGAPPMDCEIEGEATLTLHEFGEGAEPMAFWESLGSRDRRTYDCLLHTQGWSDGRPRLFQLNAPGEPQVTEYPAHGSHCLPFTQHDLCTAAQPALFLMDAQQQVFLWIGWCLPDRERPGSWDAEIQRALRICHEYYKGQAELASREGVDPPEAFVICAGHEPLSFTNLFPCWESWKCVNPTENKHGRKTQRVLSLEDVLERLEDPSRQWPPISDWLEHQSHVCG
uniref:supervillin-like isoform X3 n=1 Tax=Myxine glutinosa TaxID=7769 RepID=UPI0035902588